MTRENRLEQATFLRSLAEEFDRLGEAYLETRGVLVDYQNVPKEMPEEEADIVIDALRDCCRSVKFLFKIAQLVKAGVLDSELLYIFYYEEVWGYLTEKLKFLMRWVGTGLDLGANYNAHELARMMVALQELSKELSAIHQKHGGDLEGYKALMMYHQERAKGFLADPSQFSVGSPNYIDNWVEIKKSEICLLRPPLPGT